METSRGILKATAHPPPFAQEAIGIFDLILDHCEQLCRLPDIHRVLSASGPAYISVLPANAQFSNYTLLPVERTKAPLNVDFTGHRILRHFKSSLIFK